MRNEKGLFIIKLFLGIKPSPQIHALKELHDQISDAGSLGHAKVRYCNSMRMTYMSG